MSICDRCIHSEVCGLEGNHEEAIAFCSEIMPKTGHWINIDEKSAICSCCNRNNTLYGNFCKWCGAKMQEVEEPSENHEEKPHSLLDAYFRMRAEQESKSEWQHDHEILKAYSDGANAVLDKVRDEIKALPRELPTDARNMVRRTRVLEIIDKYKEEQKDADSN